MADGMDDIAGLFTAEIAPQSRPRDIAGKFVQTIGPPEKMFGERRIEGEAAPEPKEARRERQTDRDDEHGAIDTGPERLGSELDETDDGPLSDEERAAVGADETLPAKQDEADEKYEVTIDGATARVSLSEALNGYIRQATFHKRMAELNQARAALEEDVGRRQAEWGALQQARTEYEQDLQGLIPAEPDWDKLYAQDPAGAYHQHKIFQQIYGQLARSRQLREQQAAVAAAEADRRLQEYAINGFSKFVMDSGIPDKASLKKEIHSMRRTAFSDGFSEQEVATIYDPRMLSVLRKASKYDRMMAAAKPKAVVPEQTKTLTPGAATPLGNAPRKSLDDAQRRLASSGRLDDAAEVFRRML